MVQTLQKKYRKEIFHKVELKYKRKKILALKLHDDMCEGGSHLMDTIIIYETLQGCVALLMTLTRS